MVRTILHLIGGGPGALRETAGHFHDALSALGKPRPLVAYVGAASNDNALFLLLISGVLAKAGARVEAARLASPRAKISRAKQLLEDCDLVFISGGDVERGMKIFEDRDVISLVRDLAKQGKPMMGISAGSILLGREWVRFPDGKDPSAETFPCLGVAPLHLDTHSEDDGWSELRILVRLLAERDGPEHTVGYGIPSRGRLVIRTTGKEIALSASGAPIPLLRARRGEVVEDGAIAPIS